MIILKCCGDEDYDFYASHALLLQEIPENQMNLKVISCHIFYTLSLFHSVTL